MQALNVVEALVNLARHYNRTVVFTIHQPRSNIVGLFDKLLLLAGGKAVYAGSCGGCQEYFERAGYPCPPGFNIADFLIDLTMQAGASSTASPDETEAGDGVPTPSGDDDTELEARGRSRLAGGGGLRSWASRTFGASDKRDATSAPAHVAELADRFRSSDIFGATRREIEAVVSSRSSGRQRTSDPGRYQKASLWTQFTILSGRAFKNLYRNPTLMLAHYVLAVVLAGASMSNPSCRSFDRLTARGQASAPACSMT